MPSSQDELPVFVMLGDATNPCRRCGERDAERVGVLGRNARGDRRTVTPLCADCLLVAVEALTDFGFRRQLEQWVEMRERMSGATAGKEPSAKGKAKRQERAALTRRRRGLIDG